MQQRTTATEIRKNNASESDDKISLKDVQQTASVELEMDFGKTLKTLAGHYNSIMKVCYELVQNALDARATKMWLVADLAKNELTFSDNGVGMTTDFFNEILKSINCSWKAELDDMVGKFGIGFWAAVDKCESFAVTTTPEDKPRGYHRYYFDCAKIIASKKSPAIPYEKCKGMQFGERPTHQHDTSTVPWRTQCNFKGITRDKIISRLDLNDFTDEVQSVFSLKMTPETEIYVKIIRSDGKVENGTIRQKTYTGTRIAEYNKIIKIDNDRSMNIRFDMYVSKTEKGKYSGKIHIRDWKKPYRVKLSNLLRSGVVEWLSTETIDALRSGVFEGDIVPSCIDLKEDRNVFAHNEYWQAFCLGIESWYLEVGKKLYENVISVHKGQKRDIESQRAVNRVLQVLNSDKLLHIRKNIEERLQARLPKSCNFDFKIPLTISSAGLGGDSPSAKNPDPKKISQQRIAKDADQIPVDRTVEPRKQGTRLASLGLDLQFVADPVRKDDLYWIDFSEFKIFVNCCNPDYMRSEQGSEDALTRLLTFIISSSLALMSLDEEDARDIFHIFLANDLSSLYVPCIV